ncbi:MAG: hypothetical protein AAB820_00125 [Patescibacteria group bacterium]
MEGEKKIGLPEAILMFFVVAFADIFDVVTTISLAVPVLGEILIVLNWFVDIVVLAIIWIWLIIKEEIGARIMITSLIGSLAEFIPLLDVLPIRTVVLLLTIYMINHPKVADAAAKLTPKGRAAGSVSKT